MTTYHVLFTIPNLNPKGRRKSRSQQLKTKRFQMWLIFQSEILESGINNFWRTTKSKNLDLKFKALNFFSDITQIVFLSLLPKTFLSTVYSAKFSQFYFLPCVSIISIEVETWKLHGNLETLFSIKIYKFITPSKSFLSEFVLLVEATEESRSKLFFFEESRNKFWKTIFS